MDLNFKKTYTDALPSIFLLILILIFFFLYVTPSRVYERGKDDLKKIHLNAIILDKYQDENNHKYETIKYKTLSENFDYIRTMVMRFSICNQIYKYAEKDDTITKPYGTVVFRVKNGQKDSTFVIPEQYQEWPAGT